MISGTLSRFSIFDELVESRIAIFEVVTRHHLQGVRILIHKFHFTSTTFIFAINRNTMSKHVYSVKKILFTKKLFLKL